MVNVTPASPGKPPPLPAEPPVPPAPSAPEPLSDAPRPRRGYVKKKDKNARLRSRRSMPPGADDAPSTEAAVAIGPTTSALDPIVPEVPVELQATPVAPVVAPSAPPV